MKIKKLPIHLLLLVLSFAVTSSVALACPAGETCVPDSLPYQGSFKLDQWGNLSVEHPDPMTTVLTGIGVGAWGIGNLSTNFGETVTSINIPDLHLLSNTGLPTIGEGNYEFPDANVAMITPAGFILSPTGSIEAASIIISTLNIDREKFLDPTNRNFQFFKDGANSFIINAGKIAAKPGGYIALLSGAIENRGTITVSSIDAKVGRIVLASGEKITVSLDDRSLISVAIDQAVQEKVFGPDGKQMDSAIKNTGSILADGGRVTLTAKSMNKVFDYAINNSGIIEAKTWVKHDGVIELVAEGAPILNTETGRIEASKVTINAIGTDFLNLGKVISQNPAENLVTEGNIYIKAINILQDGQILSNGLVTIDVEDMSTTQVIMVDPDSLAKDPTGEAILPRAVIQAKQLKITFKRLGSSSRPIQFKAPQACLLRREGDINILESLGIGTSILVQGPPADGFSVVYSEDTNLTLDADHVNLVGSAPLSLYGNITFSSLYCTAPGKKIYFEAGKTYTITGVTHLEGAVAGDGSIDYVYLFSSEKGVRWFINPKGAHEFSFVSVEDSYNLDPRLIVGPSLNHDVNSYNWDANRYWVGGSGDWNDITHWSTTSGGASGASAPTFVDDAFFDTNSDSGAAFTVTVAADGTVSSITFSTTTTPVTLSVDLGVTLTVTNGITLQNAAGANRSATLAGAGTINCASVTVGGTTTNLSADATTILTSTIATLSISGDLSVHGEDDAADDNNATFRIGSGSVSVGGTVILDAENGASATVTLATGAQTGTLTLSGATPFSTPGAGTATFTANGTGAVVIYSRSGAQTVRAVTYNNLTLSGSGAKTTAGITVNGVLSMEGTATASAAPTYGGSATLQYKGSAAQTTGAEFLAAMSADVIIDNASGVTLNAAKILNANLTLTAGTFAAGTKLTMGATGTPLITRSGGSMTGTLQGTNAYNVTYTGNSKTTGGELSGSGLKNITVNLAAGEILTLNQNRSPDGNLSVTNGIFDLSTFTIGRSASGGTLTVSDGATLKIGGTGTMPTNYAAHTFGVTSTIEYSGTTQTVAADTYGNLMTSGSVTKTFGGIVIVNGDLTVGAGTTLNTGNFAVTFGGNFVNNGTFIAGSTVITISGTGTQSIAGFSTTGGITVSKTSGTVTLTSNANAASLSFNGGNNNATNVILEIGAGVTLDLGAGAVTLLSTNANTAATIQGDGALKCGSVVVGSNNPPSSNVTRTTIMTSTLAQFNIAGNLTIASYIGTNTNRRINSTFNLGRGTVTVDGQIVTFNESAVNTSTFSMATGSQTGTLALGNASPFNITGTGTSTITLNGASTTVNYNRAGDQTVRAAEYTNLIISGSGIKTLGGNATIDGDLTVSAGTFDLSTFTADRASAGGILTVSDNAVLKIGGTNTLPSNYSTHSFGATSTIEYSGTNQTVAADTYGNLTTSGSGTKTLGGDTTVNGNITIGSGTELDVSTNNYGLTVGGNWTNGGSFTPRSGTVTFNGTGTQDLTSGGTGTGKIFNNITKTGSGTVRLVTNDVTVNGTLTLSSGTFDVGNQQVGGSGSITFTGGKLLYGGSSTQDLSGRIKNSTGSIHVDVGTNTVNYSSTIDSTNTGGLTKSGTGILRLSGSNTFTGNVTLNAGTTEVSSFQNSGTAGPLGMGNTITIGSTLAAILDITGGPNTSNRSFIIGGSGGGTIRDSSFGYLDLTGNIDNGGNLLTLDTILATITVRGIISGAGGLTKKGAGGLFLDNAGNTFSGAVTLEEGRTTTTGAPANIGVASALGTGSGTSTITLGSTASARLDLNSGSTNRSISIGGSGGGTISGSSTTLTGAIDGNGYSIIFVNGSTTVTSTISGVGTTVTLDGSLLILSGANTYTGLTTVTAGVLHVKNALALGTGASGTTVSSGAALEVQGGVTITGEALTLNGTGVSNGGALRSLSGNNIWAGDITLGSAVRINSDIDTLTLSGGISGNTQNLTVGGIGNTSIGGVIGTTSGALTKDGSGVLTLSGANTYSGGTTVSSGTLKVNNPTALGTGTLTATAVGNTIDYSFAGDQTIKTATYYNLSTSGSGTKTLAGATTVAGDLTIEAGTTLDVSASNYGLSVGGDWTNNGTFDPGTGTVTFNGTGTSTLNGTIAFYNLAIVFGKTLDLNGKSLDLNSLDNSGTIMTSSGDIDITSEEDMYVGVISHSGGKVTLTSISGAILDNNGDDNNITANDLVLSAANGIGDGDAIETEVSNLAARVTDSDASGDIEVTNSIDLIISDVAGWGEDYAIKNFGAGGIAVTVISDDSDLTVNGAVISNGGDINLIAKGSGRAYIQVNNPITVNSGSGSINLEANNTVTYADIEGGDITDDSSHYAGIEVNAQLTAQTGNVSIKAINDITKTIDAPDANANFTDNSYNDAEIYIYSEIITSGKIDILAENTITREITVDSVGGYYDYSYNYAYVYVNDALDTSSLEGTNPGAITVSAINTVDDTFNVTDYISEAYFSDYWDSGNNSNYAEVRMDYNIYSDTGDITLTAKNDITHTVNADTIDYLYSYAYNEAYVYSYYSIYSQTGHILLEASNVIHTTLNASTDDGSGGIGEYEDYSYNYAYTEVNDGISTTGGIEISAFNDITKDIAADHFGDRTENFTEFGKSYYSYSGGYYDYSYNDAEVYVYDTLDTRSDDDTDTGAITILATNTVDITLNVTDYISDYYYEYDDYNNYAYIYLESAPLYAQAGNITVKASNEITVSINQDTDEPGEIYEFYDYSWNYAEVYIYHPEATTVSTTGAIDISAVNTITREINASHIGSYREESSDGGATFYDSYNSGYYDYAYNEAYVTTNDTLDTRSGGTGLGAITVSAKNTMDTTLNVADYISENDQEYYNYAEVETYYAYTDSGDITLTARNEIIRNFSVGYIDNDYDNPYDASYLYIYNTLSSLSGNMTLEAFNTLSSEATVTAANGDINLSGSIILSAETLLTANGNLSISGALDATAGDLDINGNLDISGGTLTAPEDDRTFTVSGDWSSSGTFDPGTGTVTLDGTDPQLIGGSSAITFYDLTINNASGVSMEADVTVDGTLTLTSGTFAVGDYTLTLNGPAIAGTPSNLSTTSSSNLVFGGSSTGVGIPDSVTVLNDLTINNANDVALNSDITLSGTLILLSGKLKIVVTAAGNDKVYDGDATATVTFSHFQIVGDIVAFTYSASFADKNVGTGKTVSVSDIVVGGADGGNYVLSNTTDSTTADITTRAITVTAAANTKTYDGLLTASGTPIITAGSLAAGDVGTFSETYDNKNVGTTHVLTPEGTIADAGSDDMTGNYDIAFDTISTGEITAKNLTVTDITANNKEYDGTTAATLNTAAAELVGVVGLEIVTLDTSSAVGTFASPDVGAGIIVTVSGLTLAGADSGNYTLTQPTATADITPVPSVDNTTSNPNIATQLAAFEIPRFPLPGVGDMSTYQVNTFTPQMGFVYFYQPPTPYDMGAFDAMMFGVGDLQFLNGFISLMGHEGLMPGFDDRRRRFLGVS